jgi:hypothetical protein
MCLEEIHLEEMRAIVTQHLGPTPRPKQRRLFAMELGITEYRLRSFVDGGDLREKEWENVAKWCEDKADPRVSPYVVAVGLLTHWFAPKHIGGARRELWAFVESMYRRRGEKMPLLASENVSALLGVEEDEE